jgi:acetoin utilization deacetylase AcuC-like enzyme
VFTNEKDLEHFFPLSKNFLYAPEIGLSLRLLREDWWKDWINQRRRDRYMIPNALGFAFLEYLEERIEKEELVKETALALQNSGSRIRLALEYRGNNYLQEDFPYGKEVSFSDLKEYLPLAHSTTYTKALEKIYDNKDHLLLARQTEVSRESILENMSCLALALQEKEKAQENGFASYYIPFHSGLVEKEKARDAGLINTLSVLALDLLRKSTQRLAIINISEKHHIGTQDIFYHDNRVFTLSLHHPLPSYTGTGGEENTGIGKGEGLNENLEWQEKSIVSNAIFRFQPEIVLLRLDMSMSYLFPGVKKIIEKLSVPYLLETNDRKALKAWKTLSA